MRNVVVVSRVQKYSVARDPVHIAKAASRVSRATRGPFERLIGGVHPATRSSLRCTWAKYVLSPQSSLVTTLCIHDKAPQFNPILPKSSMSDILAPRLTRSSSDAAATTSFIPALCGPATVDLPSFVPYVVTDSITTSRAKQLSGNATY